MRLCECVPSLIGWILMDVSSRWFRALFNAFCGALLMRFRWTPFWVFFHAFYMQLAILCAILCVKSAW